MHILAFDTSLDAVSVAVAEVGQGGMRIVGEAFERRAAGHAERLMPMIEGAMEQAGTTFQDIDLIAVTLGPGSFTGVRTGVATARALSLATGRPAAGIGTLAAIACGVRMQLGGRWRGRLGVALDAHRGMVYLQLFAETGQPSSDPALLSIEDCASLVGDSAVGLAGSAATRVAAAVADRGGRVEVLPVQALPSASCVALMVSGLAAQDREPVRPLYLRAPDAKPQAGKALPRAVS